MDAKERLIKGYASLVTSGRLTIDKVPASLKEDVENFINKQ